MEIRDHMNKNEFVMSCDFIDRDEVKRLIKCINELKKSKITEAPCDRVPLQKC